ncbi:MAG: transglutaminase-like cysteine peptidase [Pseudomonadota bacterium]
MKRGILSIAVMAVTLTSQTYAAGKPAHMKTAGMTSQPIGHYEYCKHYLTDCRIRTLKTAAPKLTQKRWRDLVEVNTFSNVAIKPVTDQELYKVAEHWAYPTSFGDCEDYVLMKRHMLMERGWPASALLITVVRQTNGDGHAVLTVRTDRADFILDNLNGQIKPWNETPYRYLKRQATRHSGQWENISDPRTLIN